MIPVSRIIRNPKPPSPPSPPASARLSTRQKRTLRLLAGFLIIGGLVILLVLDRMPLPMRIMVGLMDVVAGLGLLVLVRQKG
jgi:hypothetical protein